MDGTLRAGASAVQRPPAAGSPGKQTLVGKAYGNVGAPSVQQTAPAPAQRSGAALPDELRGRFESSLGADLSAVRVHTDAASAVAACSVGARAYTIGQDIHFADGQYAPGDPSGLHLLAHEVAHTVQQAGATPHRQDKLEVSSPGDAAEVEADRASRPVPARAG